MLQSYFLSPFNPNLIINCHMPFLAVYLCLESRLLRIQAFLNSNGSHGTHTVIVLSDFTEEKKATCSILTTLCLSLSLSVCLVLSISLYLSVYLFIPFICLSLCDLFMPLCPLSPHVCVSTIQCILRASITISFGA